jgi:hypothetical protein
MFDYCISTFDSNLLSLLYNILFFYICLFFYHFLDAKTVSPKWQPLSNNNNNNNPPRAQSPKLMQVLQSIDVAKESVENARLQRMNNNNNQVRGRNMISQNQETDEEVILSGGNIKAEAKSSDIITRVPSYNNNNNNNNQRTVYEEDNDYEKSFEHVTDESFSFDEDLNASLANFS